MFLTVSFSSQTSSSECFMSEHSHLRAYVGQRLSRNSPAGKESRFIADIQPHSTVGNANRIFVTERKLGLGTQPGEGAFFSVAGETLCGSKGFRKTHTKEVVGGCG